MWGLYPKLIFTPPSQRENEPNKVLIVQVYVCQNSLTYNISLNFTSVKNWPIRAWVGSTDPKAWTMCLVWALHRGDIKSSTLQKGKKNNSWWRRENKGETLNLWKCDLSCQQDWGGGDGGRSSVDCALSALRSTPQSLKPPQSSRGIQMLN